MDIHGWAACSMERGAGSGWIRPLPLQATFQAEVEDPDEFETSFEFPYSIDVIFYHRIGETPLAPRCDTTRAEMAEPELAVSGLPRTGGPA